MKSGDKERLILDILAELRRRERAHEPPPTFRELADQFGYATPSAILFHLRPMRDDDLVSWQDNKSRTMVLTRAGRSRLASEGRLAA